MENLHFFTGTLKMPRGNTGLIEGHRSIMH
jgi:hypothetical protein